MKIYITILFLMLTGCAGTKWTIPIKAKACYTTKYGTVCAATNKEVIEVDFVINGLSKD